MSATSIAKTLPFIITKKMITIESKKDQIYTFGRDDNNKLYCEQQTFKPYFYVEDINGKFISINKVRLKKIECNDSYELYSKRKEYTKHYEGDIRLVNRFIIDNMKELKQETIRKCFIDLEIKKPDSGFDDPFKATSEILCIGCYDNFDNEHVQFVLKEYESESVMLIEFLRYIRKTDPDMMIAWNGDGFDFPFLTNRLFNVGINPDLLARKTKEFNGKCIRNDNKWNQTIVQGRILFDLMYAYKKWSSGEGRESFSLDYISQYEKLGEKIKYDGSLDELYESDIEKYKEYNKVDVELMVLLDEKLKLVDFFDSLRRLCFCRIEDVFNNSKLADSLCLKYAKDNNFVLPSINRIKETEKFAGAFVHESTPGLHKNIACLDMKSLYPSIMIGFNISYETLLPAYEEGCLNGMDVYYFKREKGIIPSIVKPLLDKRAEVKREMKQIGDENSREYKTKYMTQYTLKTIANSFYGVLGFRNFRLFKRDVASSIPYLSKLTTQEVTNWFEKKGCKAIYGDTDSVFIEMGDLSIEDITNLTKEINIYLKDWFKQYGVREEDNIIELQFEKVYEKIFFKGVGSKGMKKKYAGMLKWEDGKECYEYQCRGFESRRSDNPAVGRKFLDEVLKMIVEEKGREEIMEVVTEFERKMREEFKPEQLGIPIGISKALHKYGNSIHARAARLANERHNAGIQSGDKIKYIYVKSAGGVIAFKSDEKMPEGYEIDYEKMIRRIINLKIGPIFDSLGWAHNYTVKINSKTKIVLLKNILKQEELW